MLSAAPLRVVRPSTPWRWRSGYDRAAVTVLRKATGQAGEGRLNKSVLWAHRRSGSKLSEGRRPFSRATRQVGAFTRWVAVRADRNHRD